MAIYTLCSFACLFDKWGKKVAIYAFQAVFLFMIQLFLFADLALVNGDLEYVFFYAFVQVLCWPWLSWCPPYMTRPTACC